MSGIWMIKIGHIRFDIQQRCAVQDIHILYLEGIPLNCQLLHYGKTDPIRTTGSAGSKYAMFLIIKEGFEL